MGQLLNALLRRTVCDMCTERIRRPEGYLLTTRQVVTNPEYWEFMFANSWASVLASENAPEMKYTLAERQASQSTPWLICSSCADRLHSATPQARTDAERWWNEGRRFAPQGSGPVSVEEVRQARPPETVLQSGLPMPNKIFLIGAKFEPGQDDFFLAAEGLVGLHPPLTMEHLHRVFIKVSSTSTDEVSALTQAVDEVRRESPRAWLVDSLCLNRRTGRDLAIVAMWSGEAVGLARERLPKGTPGGG